MGFNSGFKGLKNIIWLTYLLKLTTQILVFVIDYKGYRPCPCRAAGMDGQ